MPRYTPRSSPSSPLSSCLRQLQRCLHLHNPIALALNMTSLPSPRRLLYSHKASSHHSPSPTRARETHKPTVVPLLLRQGSSRTPLTKAHADAPPLQVVHCHSQNTCAARVRTTAGRAPHKLPWDERVLAAQRVQDVWVAVRHARARFLADGLHNAVRKSECVAASQCAVYCALRTQVVVCVRTLPRLLTDRLLAPLCMAQVARAADVPLHIYPCDKSNGESASGADVLERGRGQVRFCNARV
jgi:hypothetical protein